MGAQVVAQFKAVVITILWSGVVSGAALFVLSKTIGLRVSSEDEEQGLDLTTHGEAGYTH